MRSLRILLFALLLFPITVVLLVLSQHIPARLEESRKKSN